jgi:hypothetical protein
MRVATCILLAAVSLVSAFAADREEAPRFTAKTLDGETFTDDSVRGKVVLLQSGQRGVRSARTKNPLWTN